MWLIPIEHDDKSKEVKHEGNAAFGISSKKQFQHELIEQYSKQCLVAD